MRSTALIPGNGLVAEPGTQRFYEELGYGPLVNYQPMLYGKR